MCATHLQLAQEVRSPLPTFSEKRSGRGLHRKRKESKTCTRGRDQGFNDASLVPEYVVLLLRPHPLSYSENTWFDTVVCITIGACPYITFQRSLTSACINAFMGVQDKKQKLYKSKTVMSNM